MSDKRIQWLATEGSPYILSERSTVLSWKGFPLDNLDVDPLYPSHDYGRATQALEEGREIAIIPIDSKEALVVTGSTDVVWLPRSYGGLLIRWVGADSEEDILQHADMRGQPLSRQDALAFNVCQGDLVIFDSLMSGEDALEESLEVGFRPGVYVVTSEQCRPNARTRFIAHRLERSI